MPRVQVANKLHEGRARASHSLLASLQTINKPHCNGRGFALSSCAFTVNNRAPFSKSVEVVSG